MQECDNYVTKRDNFRNIGIPRQKVRMSHTLPDTAYHNPPDKEGNLLLWDSQLLLTHLQTQDSDISLRTVERTITRKS